VETLCVVELDILSNTPAYIFQIQKTLCTQAFLADGAMKALDLSVALRMVDRRADVLQSFESHKLGEGFRNELGAIVTDDAETDTRIAR
jgi:hypothetical protein